MKKITLLFSVVLIFSISSFAQSWTAGTGTLYANPTSTMVGIGTTAPTVMLNIKNPAIFNSGSSFIPFIKIEDKHYTADYTAIEIGTSTSAGHIKLYSANSSSPGTEIRSGSVRSFSMYCTNLVAESIRTKEVEVTLDGYWPDFVFEDDYNLMSLNDLKNYISKNKHLPDVPAEKEVKENV